MDVAGTVVFLASPAASLITGANILVMVVGLLPKSTVKYKPSFPYKEIYLFPASFFSNVVRNPSWDTGHQLFLGRDSKLRENKHEKD